MVEKMMNLERSIIGAVLFSPDRFANYRGGLDERLFSDPFYHKVVRAFHRCMDEGYEINVINVSQLGEFTLSEVNRLVEIEPNSGNLSLLTRKLAEATITQKLMTFKDEILIDADPFRLRKRLGDLDVEIDSLISRNTRPDKTSLLSDFADYLFKNAEGGVGRIPTGFRTLDRLLSGGLALGDVSFVGGLPGSGKTSFMLSLALRAAQEGFKTAFIEGEMTPNEILERLNGIITGSPIARIRNGRDFKHLSRDFVSELHKLPLEIVPCYERTRESLCADIRRAVHAGCGLVFVDYLQVFSQKGRSEDEYSQIKALSETLRQIALQNPVHLCIASSLNRNETGQKRLTLASFYGSSQLGHDCAIAILLSGCENEDNELQTGERTVTLEVVKNRSGPRGIVILHFDLRSQQIRE